MNIGIANTIAIAKFAIFINLFLFFFIIFRFYELTNCPILFIKGVKRHDTHILNAFFLLLPRNIETIIKGMSIPIVIAAIINPNVNLIIFFIAFILFFVYMRLATFISISPFITLSVSIKPKVLIKRSLFSMLSKDSMT